MVRIWPGQQEHCPADPTQPVHQPLLFPYTNAEWEFLLPFIHQPEIDPPLSLGMLGAAAVINLFVTKFFKYLYCYSQVIAAR
jgi:hypothetical protein